MDDEPDEVGRPGVEPVDLRYARELEFELFYKQQMPRLVAFLIVHGAPPDLAVDVSQETMVETFHKWEDIDHPRAWIRTVASRMWWRQAQERQREHPRAELAEHLLAAASTEADEVLNRMAFLRALELLPVAQRQVMAWTYDGFQPVEIATHLGKPPATVRSLLRDARATLRRAYGSDEEKR